MKFSVKLLPASRPEGLQLYYKQTLTQVLSCEICEVFKNTYFEEHLRTTASKHRSNFIEVFCRSCCSTLINVLMKYSFSAAVVQSWRALHANLLKIALHHRYFSKNFTTGAEQRYWKLHLNGCFCGRIYFENIPAWLLLKGSCKHISILEILTHILHFLLWRHVKEERIFTGFFVFVFVFCFFFEAKVSAKSVST